MNNFLVTLLLWLAFIYGLALGIVLDTSQWLNIDCGARAFAIDLNLLAWETDSKFISSGKSIQVSTKIIPIQMGSLRFFPEGDQNCYTLPNRGDNRVLLRTGFYYGNYDSLSNPPFFYLQIDGNFWTTVNSSIEDEPIYHEIVFKPQGTSFSLCLMKTIGGGTPFISTLELLPLPADLYQQMTADKGFYLRSRVNFGGLFDIRYFRFGDENYNRIWKAQDMQAYQNVSLLVPSILGIENEPPLLVISNAIEAKQPTESLDLLFDLPPGNRSAFIVMYFMEVDPIASILKSSRKFSISINGQDMNRIVDLNSNSSCQVVTFCPIQVSGSVNLKLSPMENSKFPPIINAAELFTAIDGIGSKNLPSGAPAPGPGKSPVTVNFSKASTLIPFIFYIIMMYPIMM